MRKNVYFKGSVYGKNSLNEADLASFERITRCFQKEANINNIENLTPQRTMDQNHIETLRDGVQSSGARVFQNETGQFVFRESELSYKHLQNLHDAKITSFKEAIALQEQKTAALQAQ